MLRSRPADGHRLAGAWVATVWTTTVALTFFLISSPLALEPDVDVSMHRAVVCVTVACALTVPWLRMPRVPWAALPFLAFCLASALWSLNRADTVHFLGLYVLLALMAVVVAANASTRVLAVGVVAGGVIIVLTSFYAYWRDLPGALVPPGSSGYLAGVGTNRNIFAYTMIFAFPFAVSFWPRTRLGRVVWVVAVLLLLSGVLLTESATGTVAFCVIAAVALSFGARDRLVATGRSAGRHHRLVASGLVVGLAAVAVAWYEALGRDLHRDLSFTGRSLIWRAVWAATDDRTRWIGQGWGTVWQHPWRRASPNPQFQAIIDHLGYYVPHGHNSVMGLLPEVGLVGVALYAVIYAVPVARAVRARRSVPEAPREAGRAAVLGVIGLVLAGITEPVAAVPLGFYLAVVLIVHDPRRSPDRTPAGESAPAA